MSYTKAVPSSGVPFEYNSQPPYYPLSDRIFEFPYEYARLDSPTFSGIPTVPTPPSGDNSLRIANTAFVMQNIGSGIMSVPSTFINVKDYGAIGNGIADDTAALQSALNATNAKNMTEVFLPAGTYNISGPIYVPSRVSLKGDSIQAPLGQRTTLRATAAIDMVRLRTSFSGTFSNSVRVEGISFNGNNIAVCGIRMDQNITVQVVYNAFNLFASGATAILGGNNLYAHVDYNYFSPFDGYAIRLEDILSANPEVGYYGINVGTVSHNLIYSKKGSTLQGAVDILSNDIEGQLNGPAALTVGNGNAIGYPTICNNYLELQLGTNPVPVGIRFVNGAGILSNNRIYGNFGGTSGTIGISSFAYTAHIESNHIAGFDVGIAVDSTSPSYNYSVFGNDVSCITPVSGIINFTTISSSGLEAANIRSSIAQVPYGGTRVIGSLVEHTVRYSYGTQFNLLRGNVFLCEFNSPTTISSVVNAVPGMQFRVGSINGNTTLANSVFNLSAGSDYVLSSNQYLTFLVGLNGTVYEIGGNSAAGADFSSVVIKSPDSLIRNRILPVNASGVNLSFGTVSGQTSNIVEAYLPDTTTKIFQVDKNGNLAIIRSNSSNAIQVYNNGNTTYAFQVLNGNITSSTSLMGISFGGSVQAALGTVGAPGITFFTDTDTGITGSNANSMNLVVGGKPSLNVQASGRIGIGLDFSTPLYGLHQLGGSHRLQSLNPPSPTVSPTTTGSTSYYYFLVAEDIVGNRSLASSGRLVANSAITPNNVLTWTQIKGTQTYYILRHTSGTLSSSGLYLAGSVAAAVGSSSSTFTDTNASPTNFVLSQRNATADLIIDGSLSAGSGSFLVDNYGRISTANTLPIISAGTGAGTGPTISVSGSDTAGVLSVLTGTSPQNSSTIATVTFSLPLTNSPKAIILTPAEVNSASVLAFVNSPNTTNLKFDVNIGASALSAATQYRWHYLVIG